MAYDPAAYGITSPLALTRYGHEGNQIVWPGIVQSHNPAVDDPLPCVIFVPPGSWSKRDPEVFYSDSGLFGELANDAGAHFERWHMFVVRAAAQTYMETANPDLPDWTTATQYFADTTRVLKNNRNVYRCIRDHISGAVTNPGLGLQWRGYWIPILFNDATEPKVDGHGETTPAYGASGATDIRAFLSWLKANAVRLGVDMDRVMLYGSSAGGHSALQAVSMEPLESQTQDDPFGMRPYEASGIVQPAALYLKITPADFTQRADGALIRNLLGRELASGGTEWDEIAVDEKRAMSPVHNMRSSGRSLPTFMDYVGTSHDDSDALLINDPGFSEVEAAHHAINGWQLLDVLTEPVTSQGFDRTDVEFIESFTAGTGVRSYSRFSGAATTVTTSTDPAVIAQAQIDQFFAWVTRELGAGW